MRRRRLGAAQELLDVTRGLLEEWEDAAGGGEAGELKLDADQDETREKFRIVKAQSHPALLHSNAWSHMFPRAACSHR
jgi:hypothetical protein